MASGVLSPFTFHLSPVTHNLYLPPPQALRVSGFPYQKPPKNAQSHIFHDAKLQQKKQPCKFGLLFPKCCTLILKNSILLRPLFAQFLLYYIKIKKQQKHI